MKSCGGKFAPCITRAAASTGSSSIHAELQAQGEKRCGRKRVARLMHQQGLRVKVRRRDAPRRTRSTRAGWMISSLTRRFSVTEIERVNQVWAGDLTYILTHEGWLYLAVILDLASRRVIGWSMKRTLDASLPLDALYMALEVKCPNNGLLHHSNCGVRYATYDYADALNFQNYADGNDHAFSRPYRSSSYVRRAARSANCRQAFTEMGVPSVDYTGCMVGGIYVEQIERATSEAELEYFAI